MEQQLTKINDLIRPASFIPETRNIDVLFKNMQSQKIHMVIVVDEYGQTSGLVTMEDILEEIVGNILMNTMRKKSRLWRKQTAVMSLME